MLLIGWENAAINILINCDGLNLIIQHVIAQA